MWFFDKRRGFDERRVWTAAICLVVIALAGDVAAGKSKPRPLAADSARHSDDEAELPEKRLELRGLEETMNVSAEQRRKIEAEIATLRADRARLNQTLIDAVERVGADERRAEELEKRLAASTASEETLMKSLDSRRALIGEVLLALQRMGRRPPPALLVRPEDILEGIRASMLLGAVLPRMRADLDALKADLVQLVAVRDKIKSEKADLVRELRELEEQRAHLTKLIDARQRSLLQAQSALELEAERSGSLAAKATSLKDLIARMEAESEAARRAAEAARQADAAREAADAAQSQESRAKALAAPFKDVARLAPAVAFADLKGRLRLPATGAIVKRFGASDGSGVTEKGVSIAVRENGVVAAPCDGWVAFSGSYRTYGQLLIINAGGGYYVVLAGMNHITVDVGQFVLAGEPVASMGDGAVRTAAAIAIGARQPILYVEFRKDGTSIDPGPWWAKPEIQKVGG